MYCKNIACRNTDGWIIIWICKSQWYKLNETDLYQVCMSLVKSCTLCLRSIYSFEQLLLEISPQQWFYFLFALLSSSITVIPSVTSCTVVSLFQFSGLKRKVRIYGLNNIDQRIFFYTPIFCCSSRFFNEKTKYLPELYVIYIYIHLYNTHVCIDGRPVPLRNFPMVGDLTFSLIIQFTIDLDTYSKRSK